MYSDFYWKTSLLSITILEGSGGGGVVGGGGGCPDEWDGDSVLDDLLLDCLWPL